MFDLFYIPKTGEQALITASNWVTSKRALQQNVNKIVQYYQQYPMSIDSSHILIKLIYAMNVSKSIPLERFYDYCKSRTYNTAQSLGYTSAISRGRVWDGDFYGKGSKEVIIVNDEWFDLAKSHQNWRSLQSIKVLHHSKSDLNFNIPDGRFTSSEQGIAVLSINVPMLMVQYYHFSAEQDLLEKSGHTRKSIMQFVYSYALTNMIYSHADYAVFNRLYKRSLDEPVGNPFLRHSFSLVNVNSHVDQTLLIVDKFLKNNPTMKLHQKCLNIPSVFQDTFADSMTLPRAAPTMQIYWALITARLHALSYLLSTYERPRVLLAQELNLIQRWLRTHQVIRSIKSILDPDTFDDISGDITFLQSA